MLKTNVKHGVSGLDTDVELLLCRARLRAREWLYCVYTTELLALFNRNKTRHPTMQTHSHKQHITQHTHIYIYIYIYIYIQENNNGCTERRQTWTDNHIRVTDKHDDRMVISTSGACICAPVLCRHVAGLAFGVLPCTKNAHATTYTMGVPTLATQQRPHTPTHR